MFFVNSTVLGYSYSTTVLIIMLTRQAINSNHLIA